MLLCNRGQGKPNRPAPPASMRGKSPARVSRMVSVRAVYLDK
nr:MAG TPA: hypothetical protein [Caudoviricetes sp.]